MRRSANCQKSVNIETETKILKSLILFWDRKQIGENSWFNFETKRNLPKIIDWMLRHKTNLRRTSIEYWDINIAENHWMFRDKPIYRKPLSDCWDIKQIREYHDLNIVKESQLTEIILWMLRQKVNCLKSLTEFWDIK